VLTIRCPECGISGNISLSQSIYEGPYRCWKCRKVFMVRVEKDELKLCTPLSEEDFQQWQELHDPSSR